MDRRIYLAHRTHYINVNQSSDLTELFARSGASFRLLTEDERQTSLDATVAQLAAHDEIWVFGYGSLVWRPEFPFTERRPALLRGYHRALCLWSRVNRGTPERPGLVFGLDVGGSCRGMAYKLAATDTDQTLYQLWQREMPSGAYIPKWLNCQTPDGMIKALVFTVDRNKPAYVSGLADEQLLSIVRHAHGVYGPCAEYVLETTRALKAARIHDRRLDSLVRQLQNHGFCDAE